MLKSAFSSPKIRTLAVRLGIPFPHACGLCGMLWNFTADHAPAGDVGKHTDHQIAMALEWPGDAESLVAHLVAVRLLDVDPKHRLLIHDWQEHCPQYVRATLARKKQAFAQRTQVDSSVTTSDPTLVNTSVVTTSSSTSASTSTFTLASDEAAARLLAPTRDAKPPRSKPKDAIRWAPGEGWSGITDADRQAWATAYPACDIGRQLAAMEQWLLANPAKAKKSAWRRFVTTWMGRSQDRGGDARSNRAAKPAQKVESW